MAAAAASGGQPFVGTIWQGWLQGQITVFDCWHKFGVWQDAIGQQHEAVHGRCRGGTAKNLEIQFAATPDPTHHAFDKICEYAHVAASVAVAQ